MTLHLGVVCALSPVGLALEDTSSMRQHVLPICRKQLPVHTQQCLRHVQCHAEAQLLRKLAATKLIKYFRKWSSKCTDTDYTHLVSSLKDRDILTAAHAAQFCAQRSDACKQQYHNCARATVDRQQAAGHGTGP